MEQRTGYSNKKIVTVLESKWFVKGFYTLNNILSRDNFGGTENNIER